FTTVKNFTTFALEFLDRSLHGIDCLGADQWSHQSAGFKRISDTHLLVSRDEPLAQLRHDRFMRKHTAGGSATLTGSSDRAEHDSTYSQIHARAWSDDDGVVTAELKQTASQPTADNFTNLASHAGRAGCGNQWNATIIRHPVANSFGIARDEGENGGIDIV